eukprot:5535889-Prymnesium_polylepis.1
MDKRPPRACSTPRVSTRSGRGVKRISKPESVRSNSPPGEGMSRPHDGRNHPHAKQTHHHTRIRA